MINDYSDVDRIVIFRDLTYDEMKQEIDDNKFEDILSDRYEDFVHVCEIIEEKKSQIESVTCVFEDGQVKFDIKEKEI